MSTHRKAQFATAVVLFLALALVAARNAGWRWQGWQVHSTSAAAVEPEPQDTIYAMLAAARSGDVQSYLAAYTGEIAASLRQNAGESGPAAFRKYLQESSIDVKGIALSDAERITDTEAKVRMQFIFADRQEGQPVYLRKTPQGWRISGIGDQERIKVLVPYGTPVNRSTKTP